MFSNFNRLNNAISFCGELVLHEILHQNNFPTDEILLYNHLNASCRQTLQRLKTKSIITGDQWKVLFPTNQRTSTKDFDISISVILIINCTNIPPPNNGWKQPPLPADTSVAANVIRSRELRNKYAHNNQRLRLMRDATFNIAWSEMEAILNDLGYQRLPHKDDLAKLKCVEQQIFETYGTPIIIVLLFLFFVCLLLWVIYIQYHRNELKKVYIASIGSKVENTFDNNVLAKRFFFDLSVKERSDFLRDFAETDISHHKNQHLSGSHHGNLIPLDDLILGDHFKFIIVRGVGGMGKTHLVEEIALRWATNNSFWSHLDFVFLLKCREINQLKFKSYDEILPHKYPNVFNNYFTFNILRKFSSTTLIIVDGLDELIYKDGQFYPTELLTLLDPSNNGLPGLKVIVTGRPLSVKRFIEHFQHYDRKEVDILGFSEKNVVSFIEKMVHNETTKERINFLVKTKDSIALMTRIPIYLKLICSIYGSYDEIGSINTLTELYIWQLALYMWKHAKSKGIPKVLDDPIEIFKHQWVKRIVIELSELSYQMFIEHLAVIEKESIKNLNLYKGFDELGFFIHVSPTKVQFFHMTFQEFMVVIYFNIHGRSMDYMEYTRINSAEHTILPLYAGLQGVHENNSQSALIVKRFVKIMNFTGKMTNVYYCLSDSTWNDVRHEFNNKITETTFFRNRSCKRYHLYDFVFPNIFETKIIKKRTEPGHRYTKCPDCLRDRWDNIHYIITITYYKCHNNGYYIFLNFKPCNAQISLDDDGRAHLNASCLKTNILLAHERIGITYVRYRFTCRYDIRNVYGKLSDDICSTEVWPNIVVYHKYEYHFMIKYVRDFNAFVESMKMKINRKRDLLKTFDVVTVIEYEQRVSSEVMLFNTTIRESIFREYRGRQNLYIFIYTLCCEDILSCPGMTANLYKRYNRGKYECCEKEREIVTL